ncbi:MAG: hypothetical protein KAU22_08010 [Desulfuromonadales bacterium]|nr:hypothetical protein [Desulfuromonadales bacterium]
MRKIRICIGSNDGHNIAATHMGDTESFYIYDLFDGGGSKVVEQRDNTARLMDHSGADKMTKIISLLADTEVFVAKHESPNFTKIAKQTKYQPVIVKTESISDILTLLQTEFDEIYPYVERRKNGEKFATIPKLLSSD